MRKFIDRVQVWLYLAGFMWLAHFVGRWGTKAIQPHTVVHAQGLGEDDDIYERDTLPDGVPPGRENMEGRGWRLDEFPPEPLKVINFDHTHNDNRLIDMSRDLAIPNTKLDVN